MVDGMYHKDDKYYILQNGEIVETEPPVVDPTEDPYMEYGEVIGDIQDNGAIQWNFYYKGELLANLEHLTRGISCAALMLSSFVTKIFITNPRGFPCIL